MKKLLTITGVAGLMLLFTITVNAANNQEMNDVLSNLTNFSEEEIVELREEKTYGEIAKEENVYNEFKEARISAKINHIERKVAEGKVTEEEAEKYINLFLEKAENCDGNRVEMRFGQGKRNR